MVHYLHNSGCCRRSVAPWITVVSQHTVFTKLLWCDIPWNKAPHTGPHHIWCTYTHCHFSGHEKNIDSSRVGWMISLASAGYSDSSRTFVASALGLPTNLGFGQSWLFLVSSVKFHTRSSLKSWWEYLASHEDNSSQLSRSVRYRNLKNNFMVHLKVHQPIK
jgi:hypothetical protein